MERDRHHCIGIHNQIPSRAANPLLKQLGQIGPVGMFEPQDQVAGALIIEARGTRPRKGPWPRHTGRTQSPDPLIELERNAAAIADRIVQKADLQEGIRRQSRPLRGPFGKIARRKQQIEHGAKTMPHFRNRL